MTEKITKKYECDRCPNIFEKKVEPGFLGIVKNPKAPKGWDKRNEVQLCPSCVTKHDNGYKKFFADFMASGKNEKKSD